VSISTGQDQAEVIERLKLEKATQTFALLYRQAIEAGQEPDLPAAIATRSERPMTFAPAPHVEELPRVPQTLKLSSVGRRREMADIMRVHRERSIAQRGRYTIMDLKEDSCRYTEDAHFFCGAPSPDGHSWCEAHQSIVYRRAA
jgi:hypothetical protein